MIEEILSSFLTDFLTDEVKDATGSSTETTEGKDPASVIPIQKTMEDSVANFLGIDSNGNTKLDRYGSELEDKATNYLAELTGINPSTIKGDGQKKQKQQKQDSFTSAMSNALNTVQSAASVPPTMRGVYATKIKQDNASAMFKNWGK